MVVNLRLYVITIAAIFIAIGMGIFIGFNLNGEYFLLKQQQLLVEGLEGRVSEILLEKDIYTEEINGLAAINKRKIGYIKLLCNAIASNRLKNERIAVIITNEQYYYGDLEEILKKAGAEVAVEVIYTDKLLLIDKHGIDELNNSFGYEMLSREELFEAVNHQIVNAIIYGEKSIFLEDIIYEGFIRFEGELLAASNKEVGKIVVAGGDIVQDKDKMNSIDKDIIERLSVYRRTIIGVERYDVGFSYIPFYKSLGISTVDNANTDVGHMSLVLLLAGAEGHYGEKETAEGLFPSIAYKEEEFLYE